MITLRQFNKLFDIGIQETNYLDAKLTGVHFKLGTIEIDEAGREQAGNTVYQVSVINRDTEKEVYSIQDVEHLAAAFEEICDVFKIDDYKGGAY